jgi:AAA+ superfamily predicted ATPase
VEAFAKAKLCTMLARASSHNQSNTGWNKTYNELYQTIEHGNFQVEWQGKKIDLLLMNWGNGICKVKYYWILADTEEVANNFFSAVCEWNLPISKEILVFEDGYWSKDKELFEAIQTATFDNLVLGSNLKKTIQDDLIDFLNVREEYENYDIPWKRGMLLIGPPGNGKSHTIKAAINKMQLPCLYVRSLDANYFSKTSHHNIYRVFQQARQSAPCILVLEDIDSLIGDEDRSFFLNQLDGFTSNQGIMILATTNHPDRIDPAIINRPSRFDRKYHFELPALTERVAYINLWNDKFKLPMRLSDAAIADIAELTDGFSFAYLKELILSSMMQWMKTREPGTMEKYVISQVTVLREQMSS